MKKMILLALALALTACENAPDSFHPAPFAFEQGAIAPLAVNVGKITITDHYQSPLRRPNVEQDFPTSPANAVKKWVAARLRATGNSGVLDIEIHDASAIEVPLPKTQGITGLFTDDQDARYDTKLSVTYRLYVDGSAAARATGDVMVSRSRSIHERATMNERSALYQQLTAEVMADFERESTSRLRQYFGNYLR